MYAVYIRVACVKHFDLRTGVCSFGFQMVT